MNKKIVKNQKVFMDYLADIGAWVLGGAMFIYLGFRTLDWATYTFREDDAVFAYLILFSTTIGAIIFALIKKRSFYFDAKSGVWRSDEFRKTVSTVMMIVCALGEVALAIADMTLITAEKGASIVYTAGELKSAMWLTAGLAGLVGVAIAAIKMTPPNPSTDPEIDMSHLDADNNGVIDSRENNAPRPAMNVNALETEVAKLREENAKLRSDAPKANGGSETRKTPPQD